ncbi:hypothetical protein [Rhodococcus phenolicus]|uniref:hypothetical protein n=1 Tax=Rhodococcus phenolicus TaxID=263849 RepID=UPI000831613D|nr:hypothetical protein [Rhodococcus phenolicus]
MPAAYTNLDQANARIDALEAELAATANAARNASKAADKSRAEITELKMTATAPAGTDYPPAVAESVIKKLPPEVVDALRDLLNRTGA